MKKHESQLSALLLIIVTVLLSCCHGNEAACIEYEKQALLTFKEELIDPSNRLSSWTVENDCCSWEGVVCSNITNHVTELHLQNPKGSHIFYSYNGYFNSYDNGYDIYYNYEMFNMSALFGNLSPSLLYLKQLHFLDLTLNRFEIPFPSFIGSLKSLQYLNLSYVGFYGIIPPQLGNLSNLHTLIVLGEEYPYYNLGVKNLQWLTGLSNLKHLDMRFVNLSQQANWIKVINMIPSLRELDLSGCDLYLDSHLVNLNLSFLTVLDLSGNSFGPFIPRWIFGLSTLVSLDLSSNQLEGPFLPKGPWNLTSLIDLDLSRNNLNGALPGELFSLNNLISLDVSNNGFNNLTSSTTNNMTSLQSLDASFNNLGATIPDWLYDLRRLESLNLRDNQLQGALQDLIANMTSLVDLDLSGNKLTGRIPSTRNICKIRLLDLSSNKLEGPVSEFIDGMARCFSSGYSISGPIPSNIGPLSSLKTLHLGGNRFNGTLPWSLGKHSNLQHIDFGDNSISGPIPSNIGLLSSLQTLRLGGNKLNGTLPRGLGQLSNLVELNISHNMMEGIVTDRQFHNLTNLRWLWASGNFLTLKVDQDWVPVTRFTGLELRSWKLGPQFPMWLLTQTEIRALDLSFTGISGTIPSWIWNFSNGELTYLNLSNNQLQGELRNVCCIAYIDLSSNQLDSLLPDTNFTQLYTLDLSHNSFSGGFSHFLRGHGNQKLYVLILSDNLLSEEMPDCWMNWQKLLVLNLENNNLTGSIPMSMRLPSLIYLHLGNNSLSGMIPSVLQYCKELRTINFAKNNLTGYIPTGLGLNLPNLKILNLRSNKLYGELPLDLCLLTALQVLDVANNIFSGVIPRCFNNFTSMRNVKYTQYVYVSGYAENVDLTIKGNKYNYDAYSILPLEAVIDLSNNNFTGQIPEELTSLLGLNSLNLSGNRLGGLIPRSIGNLAQLESLDLSRNQLLGHIPSSITNLFFLGFLNLSYNHLSGQIPLSTQMQSFNASSFTGNQLCGRPLTENCSNGIIVIGEEEADGSWVDYWFYVFMGLGYVVGFWGICFTLILKKSWRYAYFRFVDEVWYKISGHIPSSITNLSFLGFLDLSYNHLLGQIPLSTQMQSFSAFSFIGNQLCGLPLTENCTNGVIVIKEEEDCSGMDYWFYIFMGLGYVVSFWGVCFTLILNKSWRYAYFRFVDEVWYKLPLVLVLLTYEAEAILCILLAAMLEQYFPSFYFGTSTRQIN